MAIYTITGKPRSGKSYWITYTLYFLFIAKRIKRSFLFGFFYKYLNRFVSKKNRSKFVKTLRSLFEPRKKVFYYAYTNVKGFKFDITSRIKPLDFEALYNHLEYLHALYLSKCPDSDLIEYSKLHNLYKVIFVIDECQDYFAKKDSVLMWWFAYHGHMYHDIYILTQNLGQIYEEYFKFSEFYYRAVPPSNRLFSSNFAYIRFNSYKLFKTERIGTINIPALQEVYDMYESGDDNYSSSFVKKYFLIAIFLFIALLVAFILFLSSFSSSSDNNVHVVQDNNTTAVVKQLEPSKKSLSKSKDDNKSKEIKDELFDIRCVSMLCTYKGVDFPKPLLNKLTAKLEPEFIWFFNNGSYTQYFVMLPSDTFDFLQKNEEKSSKGQKNGAKSNDKTSSHFPLAVATSNK